MSFSTFGPIRRSVIRCLVFFDLLSFGVRSIGVRSFGVRSFGVRSFGVGSFGVRSLGVRSFDVQSFGVQQVNHMNVVLGRACYQALSQRGSVIIQIQYIILYTVCIYMYSMPRITFTQTIGITFSTLYRIAVEVPNSQKYKTNTKVLQMYV